METLEQRVLGLEIEFRGFRAREENRTAMGDQVARSSAQNAHVSISGLFGEVKEFRAETQAAIHGLTETARHHGVLLRDITRQQEDHTHRLGRMERTQQEHGARLDGIDGRLERIEQTQQEHGTRLDGIDGRLDRVEGNQVAANRMLQEILDHIRK
ncbi:hypothetical protein [Acrocarpospora catenulata]|uniref:hypothetical protein n=1 Tax=Acrocarpospora catenulata TaxID=2836182 RepID=UPI001BDA29C3|nr:hypothetical protein [Acrocarpospora catenulata]